MDVHFVAVPADRMVAVDVPVTVYEVIHIAVMPLAIHDDILKIKLSRFGEQREKFVRYIVNNRKSTYFNKIISCKLCTKRKNCYI